MSTESIARRGRRAGRSPWVERLGRAGLVAKGVLYLVLGLLAVKVALGARDEEADREGVLREVAAQPFGRGLLTLLAVGFFGYAIWRLAQGFLDRDAKGANPPGLAKRAGAVARGAWWGALGVLTVLKIVGAGSEGASGREDEATAGVLGLPLGRYVVFAAAAGFLGAAAFNGYRALTGKFRKRLRTERMNEAEEQAATWAGTLGHAARFVVFGLIGLFLAKAAWEFDADETRSLDGALREVAAQPYGTFLLCAVAIGLGAYGLYSFAQARYRDV
jgi:hypothetical protein